MDNKQSYLNKMAEQLQKWDKDIQLLKARAEHAKETKKTDIEDTIRALNEKRSELRDRMEKMRSSSSSAWNEIKKGFDKSVSEFRQSLDKALGKFR